MLKLCCVAGAAVISHRYAPANFAKDHCQTLQTVCMPAASTAGIVGFVDFVCEAEYLFAHTFMMYIAADSDICSCLEPKG